MFCSQMLCTIICVLQFNSLRVIHFFTQLDPLDETALALQEEKQKSLAILQAMMGRPMVTLPKQKSPSSGILM